MKPGPEYPLVPRPASPPAFETADRPHGWTVFMETVKTVITVSGVLLAFTVPFYKEIIGAKPSPIVLGLLALMWGSLLFSIFCGLFSLARLSSYLRQVPLRTKPGWAPRLGGWSIYALMWALVPFAILAGTAIFATPPEPMHSLPAAQGFVHKMTGIPVEQLWVIGTREADTGAIWIYRLRGPNGGTVRTFEVGIEVKTRQQRFCEELLPKEEK